MTWTYHGEVLSPPSWMGPNSWAPDVSLHDGEYFMYFAASGPNNVMCLTVATSAAPLGPFQVLTGGPLLCSNTTHPFGALDPKSWDDPATGKTYL